MSDTLLKPSLPGIALRRWRVLHRVKQSHAAELFKVTQSTISRWESGVQALDPDAHLQLERLLAARLESAADQALARLKAHAGLELPGIPAEYFQALAFDGELPVGVVSYHEAFDTTE